MKKTFENFVISGCSQLAMRAINNLFSDEKPKLTFIHGQAGSGKSHLALAIYNMHIDSINIKFISAYELTNELITYMKKNKIEDFYDHYLKLDCLIIDDVQDLVNKEGTQATLIKFLNEFQYLNKKILLFSDRSPEELHDLQARLQNRLQAFAIIEMSLPNIDTKMKIAQMKAQEIGLTMTEEELKWPAFLCKTTREIEGMLLKMKTIGDNN